MDRAGALQSREASRLLHDIQQRGAGGPRRLVPEPPVLPAKRLVAHLRGHEGAGRLMGRLGKGDGVESAQRMLPAGRVTSPTQRPPARTGAATISSARPSGSRNSR